jgi:hypothetical protein
MSNNAVTIQITHMQRLEQQVSHCGAAFLVCCCLMLVVRVGVTLRLKSSVTCTVTKTNMR